MKKSRLVFIAGIIAISMYNSSSIDENDFAIEIPSSVLDLTRASYAEEYVTMCDNVEANYKYEEYYISDEEIKNIVGDVVKFDAKCSNDVFDRDLLLNNIMENSARYAIQNGDMINAFNIGNMYDEVDSNILSEVICNTIWDTIVNDSSDELENYCSMSQIKVVINNNIDDATAKYINRVSENSDKWDVIDSYTIMINMNTVIREYEYKKKKYDMNPSVYENPGTIYDYFSLVLKHELNHVMQYACDCRYDAGKMPDSIEICYDSYDGWDSVGNSLIEASAESSLYAYNIDNCKNESYIYENYRRNEALLFLMSIFKSDISEYYDAIKNSSFKELYDFFDLDSDEDYNNFYKALYSMETISNDNAYLERLKDADYNNEINYDNHAFCNNYVIDIYKLFVKNLISHYYEFSDLSYEECIFLNEFAKTVLLSTSCDYFVEDGELVSSWDENIKLGIIELDEIFNSFIENEFSIVRDVIEEERDVQQEVIANIMFNKGFFNEIENQEIINKFPIIKNVVFVNDIGKFYIVDSFDEIYFNEREEIKEYIKSY